MNVEVGPGLLLKVPCPVCRVRKGVACVDRRTGSEVDVHGPRIARFKAVVLPGLAQKLTSEGEFLTLSPSRSSVRDVVGCSRCMASRGEACRSLGGGGERVANHVERVRAYRAKAFAQQGQDYGQRVAGRIEFRERARGAVPCPECGSAAGHHCRSLVTGSPRVSNHAGRTEAFRLLGGVSA